MANLLLAGQIIQIVAFIGSVFILYHLLVKVHEGRIKGMEEEIKRLNARLETPSDLQAKLTIIETYNKKEIEQIEKDKQEAIKDGNKALTKEKADHLKTRNELAAAIVSLHEQLSEYEKINTKREMMRNAIAEGLSTFRLTESQSSIASTLENALGKEMFMGSTCPHCVMSHLKCWKCGRNYCKAHVPQNSLGTSSKFICGNCSGPNLKGAVQA